MSDDAIVVTVFAVISMFGVLMYFVPSVVALVRRHRNAGAIMVLNALLGWSIIGWIVAIIWAMTSNTQKEVSP